MAPGPRPRRWRRPSGKAIAALLGALASLTSVLAFGREVFQPDPPAANKKADIMVAELNGTRERLGDYLRDTSQSTDGLTDEQLAEEGISAQVTVRIEGSIDEKPRLRWSLYTADGERLRDPIYNQIAVEFTPEAVAHDATVPVWSPLPPERGEYELRFSLIDEEGRPLDVMSTRPFRIRRVPDV